jgi:riboflavin synthase
VVINSFRNSGGKMFTGIISDIGTILNVEKKGDREFTIACNYRVDEIAIGASIAHNGICLTVTDKGTNKTENWYKVTVSEETINCTNLTNSANGWHVGALINLERSLKVGDELGGHIVTGHIDGIAKVTEVQQIGDSTKICFIGPDDLTKFIARKGSIALNGTSLTVNRTAGSEFEVNLIPHTKQNTTWNRVQKEDIVNIEIDPLARYVAKLNELRE